MTSSKTVELVAPAGNREKLMIAIHYGADAVYLGGKDFSLRSYAANFTLDEISQAVDYAHGLGVKVYVACNIYARNDEQDRVRDYLGRLGDIGPDALIMTDPGIILTAGELVPHLPVHLSTQSNTTNFNSALFWAGRGVRRVIAARELSLSEIKTIAGRCPIEIEAFVHGAMCISYSGRCLLSNFLAGRDGNRGMCCHPCRWRYALMEETRPGKYMPIAEDERGTYILNSKDLCMIDHIPELIESGVAALKIEGRMKGINYLASAVKVYREAIDTYYENPLTYQVRAAWGRELEKINHRGYSTGFYFGEPDQVLPNFENLSPRAGFKFVGKVLACQSPGRALVEVRNRLSKNDAVEVLPRRGPAREAVIHEMADLAGQAIRTAQPGWKVNMALSTAAAPNDLIRRIEQDA